MKQLLAAGAFLLGALLGFLVIRMHGRSRHAKNRKARISLFGLELATTGVRSLRLGDPS